MTAFRKITLLNYCLVWALITVFSGCATVEPSLISKYMTQEEVKNQFGSPLYVRTAQLKDGREIEEWEYMNKGLTKTRTVMFFNSEGKLIHWEEYRPWFDKPSFDLPQEVYE